MGGQQRGICCLLLHLFRTGFLSVRPTFAVDVTWGMMEIDRNEEQHFHAEQKKRASAVTLGNDYLIPSSIL